MYRLMQPSDEAAVLALWQSQHHDTEDFAKMVLERFAGMQNIYVADENDAIVAAALAVPVTLQGRTGNYLCLCGEGSLLLAGLLVCAVATALVKKPLRAVIIYMAYSIIMSVIWILLEAPDLALTEAAVGAGITGILFFLTLRRIDRIDRDADVEETQGEEEPHEENEATH